MRTLSVLAILLFARLSFAADGVQSYLQGLDALEAGKFADASSQFEKAVDADDENPDYRIALGVSLTLGEKLPEAEKVLRRAIKLSNNAEEARLWLATAIAMQGRFQEDTDIYPAAKFKDQYVNPIREMSRQYGQAAFAVETARRNGNDPADVEYARQQLAKRDQLRVGFPRLAGSFTERVKSKLPAGQRRQGDPAKMAISDALLARIQSNIQQQQFALAQREINPLLRGNPNNPQLMVYHAICALNLGAPEIARRQFTRALYSTPMDGDLYAQRAVAAARTGDQRRAAADLETAQLLKSNRLDWAKSEVAAAPKQSGEPKAMLDEMYNLARSGAAYTDLLTAANQLILAENGRRLRMDEAYIDTLREHQLAVNQNPKEPSRLAAFAAFLYDNAVAPRGEAVELRADWRPYRPVDDAMLQAELTRALNIANEALAIDEGNVSAMITKAAVLVNRMQLGDAEAFLKKALALAPTEPRLLRLFAEVADRAAAAKQAQASSLRTPTTWEDSLYIYTRYPSGAERAQADALEAQANRLWEMARIALRQAIDQSKTPAEKAFFSAVLGRRDGQLDTALADARRAVELEPTRLEYLDMLTTLLAASGNKVEALLNQSRAANLVHSTAGPALKCVWFSLPRTKFKTSREYLAIAAEADAADPRIAAYYGAVAGADEKTEVAAAWYSVASALYEARARFEGVSTDSKEPSPLREDTAVTILNVNLRAIELLRADKPKQAESIARISLAMEPRIDPSVLYQRVPASMLPDVNADQIPVPQADHASYLLAMTRMQLGRALIKQNRNDEAIQQLQLVAGYLKRVPPTVDAGSQMHFPVATAQVWLLSAMLAKGDTQSAVEQYKFLGRPRGLDAETEAEARRIGELVQKQQSDAWNRQEEDAIRQQREARDAALRERQRQIEEINRRRRP